MRKITIVVVKEKSKKLCPDECEMGMKGVWRARGLTDDEVIVRQDSAVGEQHPLARTVHDLYFAVHNPAVAQRVRVGYFDTRGQLRPDHTPKVRAATTGRTE